MAAETALLTQADARLMAMVFRKEPMPPDLEFTQVDADRWVDALRAIATGLTTVTAAGRVGELERENEALKLRLREALAMCEEAETEIDDLEERLNRYGDCP